MSDIVNGDPSDLVATPMPEVLAWAIKRLSEAPSRNTSETFSLPVSMHSFKPVPIQDPTHCPAYLGF